MGQITAFVRASLISTGWSDGFILADSLADAVAQLKCVWAVKRTGRVSAPPSGNIITVCAKQTVSVHSTPLPGVR